MHIPEAHGPSKCYMFEVQNPGCEGQNPTYEGPMSLLWDILYIYIHTPVRFTISAFPESVCPFLHRRTRGAARPSVAAPGRDLAVRHGRGARLGLRRKLPKPRVESRLEFVVWTMVAGLQGPRARWESCSQEFLHDTTNRSGELGCFRDLSGSI